MDKKNQEDYPLTPLPDGSNTLMAKDALYLNMNLCVDAQLESSTLNPNPLVTTTQWEDLNLFVKIVSGVMAFVMWNAFFIFIGVTAK